MKILVTVKRVTDYEAKLKVAGDGKSVALDGVNMIMNPFDEIAVEEALQLKEKHGGEVVAVSVGSSDSVQQLRSAMAMGADSGVLVKTDKKLDCKNIAKCLRKIVEQELPDLVLMGKQAIDDDSHQVCEMLAEMLGWGQATQANTVTVDGQVATVVREADGGLETVELDLPGIITSDLRLNEPRYASLPGIMKAKRKPLKEIPIEELGLDLSATLDVLKLEVPTAKSAGEILPDVATLVEKLKTEAKVI